MPTSQEPELISREPAAASVRNAQLRSAKPFLIVAVGFLLYVQAMVIVLGVRPGIHGLSDFRQLYTAGYMGRTGDGHQLYDYARTDQLQNELAGTEGSALPFNHLAIEALLFAPLSLFSFRVAYCLMLLLNLGLLVSCFLMLRRYLEPLRSWWSPLPACLFGCFLPFGVALVQGQDSILLTLLFSAGTLFLAQKRDAMAGLLLACALFKFQFVIPVIVLFCAWKRWKLVYGFLAGASIVAIISVLVAGPQSVVAYVRYLFNMSISLSAAAQVRYGVRPAAMPNLRGAISVLFMPLAGQHSVQVITIVASILVMAWASRAQASLAVAVVTAVLVSYHCLYHDLSLMIVPLVLTIRANAMREWVWPAAAFAGIGLAVAWDLPRWTISLLILAFLAFLVRGGATPVEAVRPSPAQT